jgi:hypothetical protein
LLSVLLVLLTGCTLSSGGTATPLPTPDIPQVEFLFPPQGTSIFEGADLTIDLLAQDETGGIGRVELYLNDQLLREAEPETPGEPVYRVEFNWFAEGAGGRQVLSAIAYRQDGTASSEVFTQVEVLARLTPTEGV